MTTLRSLSLAAVLLAIGSIAVPPVARANAPFADAPRDLGLRLGMAVLTPVLLVTEVVYLGKGTWMHPLLASAELLGSVGWLMIGLNGEDPDMGAVPWLLSAWFATHAVVSFVGYGMAHPSGRPSTRAPPRRWGPRAEAPRTRFGAAPYRRGMIAVVATRF